MELTRFTPHIIALSIALIGCVQATRPVEPKVTTIDVRSGGTPGRCDAGIPSLTGYTFVSRDEHDFGVVESAYTLEWTDDSDEFSRRVKEAAAFIKRHEGSSVFVIDADGRLK